MSRFLPDCHESFLLSPHRTRTVPDVPPRLPRNILPFQVSQQTSASTLISGPCVNQQRGGVTLSLLAGVWVAKGSRFTRTSSSPLSSTLSSPLSCWQQWQTTRSWFRGIQWVELHNHIIVFATNSTWAVSFCHPSSRNLGLFISYYIKCPITVKVWSQLSSSDELQSVPIHSSLPIWLQLLLDAVWGDLPAHSHRGGRVCREAASDVVLPPRLGCVPDNCRISCIFCWSSLTATQLQY